MYVRCKCGEIRNTATDLAHHIIFWRNLGDEVDHHIVCSECREGIPLVDTPEFKGMVVTRKITPADIPQVVLVLCEKCRDDFMGMMEAKRRLMDAVQGDGKLH